MNNKICFWYETSRIQREHEIERGLSKEGTTQYEILGCYNCEGHKKECSSYQPILTNTQEKSKKELTFAA